MTDKFNRLLSIVRDLNKRVEYLEEVMQDGRGPYSTGDTITVVVQNPNHDDEGDMFARVHGKAAFIETEDKSQYDRGDPLEAVVADEQDNHYKLIADE